MPRPSRSFDEGFTYHVYNRVGGGWPAFTDAALATKFVDLLRSIVRRHEVMVFGWCLLSNHYHLILRQGPVPLSRTLQALQQEVTRTHNLRENTFGPLWQGRFKAIEVASEDYLLQLVAYVHLNPVKAGLTDDIDSYLWSGHREITGQVAKPIVAVDDVLLLYGDTRGRALKSYRTALSATAEEAWSGEGPGSLPWWPLGRPTRQKREILQPTRSSQVDMLGRSTARWRPRYSGEEWIEIACEHFGVSREDISNRGRQVETVMMRDLIGLVGIERYRVKVVELAQALGKSRDGVSIWARRGAVRRTEDPDFAKAAKELDDFASEER